MYSLKELYRNGLGPSSSHTIGPFRAGNIAKQKFPNATSFRVTLQGSLAATGIGHFTDKAIEQALGANNVEILWRDDIWPEQHPNGLIFEALDKEKNIIGTWEVFSVGGGALVDAGDNINSGEHKYPHKYLMEIIEYCQQENITLWQYVDKFDDQDIWSYLNNIRQIMFRSIEEGLENKEQYLPGPLKYTRRASEVYQNALKEQNPTIQEQGFLSSYALAVSEQNASMGEVVTAPTCGACGVVPAVLKYIQDTYKKADEEINRALAVAGILGLLAKHNASISGAEAGCQAEVGVACAMAAGAAAYLMDYDIYHIEYAAEVAMEHHLGMTCDPLGGYVQVPCIERNATAAVRAVQSAYYVHLTGSEHLITYDEVLKTMMETGKDMREAYKETSLGGLAKYYNQKLKERGLDIDIKPQKGGC